MRKIRRNDEAERQRIKSSHHRQQKVMDGAAKEGNASSLPEDMIFGRNAVIEALKAKRGINRIIVSKGQQDQTAEEIIRMAREQGIPLQFMVRQKMDALAMGGRHQGVMAQAAPVPYVELEDILKKAEQKQEQPFLILLDELEDPHNFGALLRTADAVGAHGVLVPRRRSVPLNATVAKTSAGAVEYVPVARIGNVAQTLKRLKKEGFWVIGADMDGKPYDETDLTGPVVLIIGSEGHGMTRLTKELCDIVVRLPMKGHINSLNASVAGAVLMYEILHQRSHAARNSS